MANENLLYDTYKNAGPVPIFIVAAAAMNLVTIPSVFMNLFIVYVTAKYRSLHGTSFCLLAFTALLESLRQVAHLFQLVVALSGPNFVAYSTSFGVYVVPLYLCSTSQVLIALTGFDRLFQIALPNRHSRLNPTLYLALQCALSLAIGALVPVHFAQMASAHSGMPVTGALKDVFGIPEFGVWYECFVFGIQGCSIAFYAGVWCAVRRMHSVSIHQAKHSRMLLRSLITIVLINVGSYLFWAIALGVYPMLAERLRLNAIHGWIYQMVFAVLLNVGVALNAPVLYVCSAEYRKCFLLEIGRIITVRQGQETRVTTVHVTTVVAPMMHTSSTNQTN